MPLIYFQQAYFAILRFFFCFFQKNNFTFNWYTPIHFRTVRVLTFFLFFSLLFFCFLICQNIVSAASCNKPLKEAPSQFTDILYKIVSCTSFLFKSLQSLYPSVSNSCRGFIKSLQACGSRGKVLMDYGIALCPALADSLYWLLEDERVTLYIIIVLKSVCSCLAGTCPWINVKIISEMNSQYRSPPPHSQRWLISDRDMSLQIIAPMSFMGSMIVFV